MLLTRLPLPLAGALDLHVLSLPPAFALSQDQTLKFEILIWRSHVLRVATLARRHIHFDEVQHVIVCVIAHTSDKCCS